MRIQTFETLDLPGDCADWSPPNTIRFASASSDDDLSKYQLLIERIVADQIVPRLLLANPPASQPSPPAQLHSLNLLDAIAPFAELVIERDADAAFRYFEEMRTQGASIEELFQDLLAPVARRLGELWDKDIKDFVDVTIGVGHLQQIVSAYSADLVEEGRRPASQRRALLMPAPGEQHTFGISLVSEQFRREGWRVCGGPQRSVDDILELLDGRWFDVIGLSITASLDPERLGSQIRTMRGASLNKNLIVIAGGLAFVNQPNLNDAIGADATAVEGHSAARQIAHMIIAKES